MRKKGRINQLSKRQNSKYYMRHQVSWRLHTKLLKLSGDRCCIVLPKGQKPQNRTPNILSQIKEISTNPIIYHYARTKCPKDTRLPQLLITTADMRGDNCRTSSSNLLSNDLFLATYCKPYSPQCNAPASAQ